MADSKLSDAKMAVLCRRMGVLWSELEEVDKEMMVPKEKIEECRPMVFGILYTNPNVSYQAFFNTMKKAWKVEEVEFTKYESGTLCFAFGKEADKNRVLASSSWSFSGHLLILQPGVPNKPPHCYKFSSCSFWVQVHGLPVEWCTVAMVKHVTQMLGLVHEVKIEVKGAAHNKVGKAKVMLSMNSVLKSGTMTNLGGEKVWLDFKYERLPRFCYSCGKMGHYTTACVEFPYDESKLVEKKDKRFGGWIKAEVMENSPFWKFFYDEEGDQFGMREEDEIIPETQPYQMPLITWESSYRDGKGEQTSQSPQPAGDHYAELKRDNDKGKQHMLHVEDIQDWENELFSDEMTRIMQGNMQDKKAASQNRVSKSPEQRKTKRFNPYNSGRDIHTDLDESKLQDTPISFAEDSTKWVLVASPMKPPGYK